MSVLDDTSGKDGYLDVFWNLGQLIAWVSTRSPDAVDALSNSTSNMTKRPHSITSGMPLLAMKRDEDFDHVFGRVLHALQSGALSASGNRSLGYPREIIPPLDWVDLVFDPNFDGEMFVRHREGHRALWCDVRVPRDQVLKSFPQNKDEGASSATQPSIFVPIGYLSVDQVLSVLCTTHSMDRTQAKETLRGALYNKLKFKIQLRATGELTDAPQQWWAGEKANDWLEHHGHVFLPDGGAKKVPNGPHFDGQPDSVNFEEVPTGQWGDFLIQQESWHKFVAAGLTHNSGSPSATGPARYSWPAVQAKFHEWRAQRGEDIPTEKEDIAYMKQFGVGRDKVRELRQTARRLPRGKPPAQRRG
jgi:hypothetical protein